MSPANQISVHAASLNDAPIVASLVGALLKELSGGNAPEKERLVGVTRELLASGAVSSLIARDSAHPIGVICLNECAAIYAGGIFGEITELYVLPNCRSLGIAPMLLKAATSFGKAKGWSRLEVGAPDQPAWKRTLQFYKKEGFAEVGPRLKLML